MNNSIQREVMNYDVVIVGAGPAGLSTAIKLKQLNKNISICVLEILNLARFMFLSIGYVSYSGSLFC